MRALKLFCFSYAGGTAEFYRGLEKRLDGTGVQVQALDYPGHGSRRKEAFAPDFSVLSADMTEQVRRRLEPDESYALMGYSMGSITATEVLCRIQEQRGMRGPEHVFLAAHEPRAYKALEGVRPEDGDAVLRQRTVSLGAIPASLVENKTFWRVYMPLFRADYSMIGRYDFSLLRLSADVPATVFYSEADTPWDEICKWSRYYKSDTAFYAFSGNHFFIRDHLDEMAAIILRRLRMY